ncbi:MULTISPECIES: DUF3263 domain-containing protein [unclassified Brevibacterium]|uniref:DUF3263 domain-containing protein n=1 Tax=unclassified Brevibacterium TaxID=2614124 RepID=UPI001E39DD86|nr:MULTISPECIES: DUF3263 domain-containing protein [unclassified Brevibacterium]MCD1287287.1 DUF3263 domain-containing protein [Brevibacterium sp. CCUG 69071]MDK8436459.1 DUF3263 domain-containing protein [Brevibacterium sp. H-BE7]
MDDLGRQVLDLERKYPKYGGTKDHAIRERFGFSATTYFQILNRLLDDPEAAWMEPVIINRLRRIRDRREK